MIEKENEIIEEIEKLNQVKKIKILIEKIRKNSDYNFLINEFNKNRKIYEENNIINKKIIELRKQIFCIDEIKEYMSLLTDIRLLSIRISRIISNIVDENNCL